MVDDTLNILVSVNQRKKPRSQIQSKQRFKKIGENNAKKFLEMEFFLFSFFFFFLGPHPRHMEVPRLGVLLEM